MPDLPMDVAVANRFISSLSKSLQALCHGCMDFNSGIEIVGYINVNIDSGSKVDYVLNEKVLKSTTNSMTFVSNSFLAKKDVPKQTRDGACSPIHELQSIHQASYRGGYQGPRSSMQFTHSFVHRGSQKRAWPGMERDWRMPPKRHRGGRMGHPSSFVSPPNPTLGATLPPAQPDQNFKVPVSSDDSVPSDPTQSLINVKQELAETEVTNQPESEQSSSTEQAMADLPTPDSIKKDPEAAQIPGPLETDQQPNEDFSGDNSNADFKGTFLHPADGASNSENSGETGNGDAAAVNQNEEGAEPGTSDSNTLPQQSDPSNVVGGEYGATSDSFSENFPSGSGEYEETGEELYSQSAYSDAGEGSNDAGQFEVIEIEDEDEDVQGLFGDSRLHTRNLQGQGTSQNQSRYISLAEQKHKAHKQRFQQFSEMTGFSDLYVTQVSSQQSSAQNQCLRCTLLLPSWSVLQDHLKTCQTCSHCGASFRTPRELKAHISTLHADTMPFSCHLCGKGYRSQVGLQLHIKVHEGKSYPCPVCDSNLSQKSALRPHLKNVHGVAQCVTCSGVFKLGQEYTQHVLSCK